jgi:membrane-bound inhibitor of C-type lysozyme
MTIRSALVIALPLLTACSTPPPHDDLLETSLPPVQPAICAPSQLAFSLDNGNGRFNGMSHSGTTLVLRNIGTSACTIPAQPLPTLTDADRQTLDIVAQDSPDSPPAPAITTLASGATVTSDMRWVSGNVYDHGHCESPAVITLAVGKQTVATGFAGHLCGPDGKPSTYTLTPFQPDTDTVTVTDAVAATDAKTLTYTCDDGRNVQAVYPDTDTAVLTLDGQTYRLHTAISADGARYVGEHWQWWTKGMTQGWLAPLKPGESIASASGVSCATS